MITKNQALSVLPSKLIEFCKPYSIRIIIILILQTRKLKLRDVKKLDSRNTASNDGCKIPTQAA